MDFRNDKLIAMARGLDSDQLELFIHRLRKELLESGLDEKIFDDAAEKAIRGITRPLSDKPVLFRRQVDSSHVLEKEGRGMDSLGRILVEYSFIRTPEASMIRPENSYEDRTARKTFTQEFIPRPLMRYFLATVRGPVAELDRFKAKSIIPKDGHPSNAQRRVYVEELVREFMGPFGSGESAIDWETVYADSRFQEIVLDLISDIRQNIQLMGFDVYLSMIENLRRTDPDSTGLNAMQRPFVINDIKQIDMALQSAGEALAQGLA